MHPVCVIATSNLGGTQKSSDDFEQEMIELKGQLLRT